MQIRKNIWNVGQSTSEDTERIRQGLGCSEFIARLLCARGITDPIKAKEMAGNDRDTLLDPFLLKDMDKAAALLKNAMLDGKRIAVFGDYDADGISATSILFDYIRSIDPNCLFVIPNRFKDGYGLKDYFVTELHQKGVEVLVTVDCGISSKTETALAKELGMTVIISDHHACLDSLPDADAVVNPTRPDCRYPFKHLAGCAVALKLACATQALISDTDPLKAQEQICQKYADIAALGTVADVMPLTGENRSIVKMGLKKLNTDPNSGFIALLDEIDRQTSTTRKANVTCSTIGFNIAPRINAAGRMDDANTSAMLFISKDISEKKALAEKLCQLNTQRKNLEEEIYNDAIEKLRHFALSGNCSFLLASSDSWHPGVIGIAASRISERTNLPCILVSFSGSENGVGHGSGRSIKGFNIAKALGQCAELLEAFGGHELAAGLSVKRDNIDELREALNRISSDSISDSMRQKQINCDMELCGNDLTIENADELSVLEPFGAGNPPPLFFVKEALISAVYPLSQGKHVKLAIAKDGKYLNALCFKMPTEKFPFKENDTVDLACTLEVNEYMGNRKVQLNVKNIRTSIPQRSDTR
ncbi:MAG: single-stranded-DNA-specific exonuclease RecJ [Ruminococcaceae bacterium]|nr:single-stranded-DNA-specific exonuclease RecJ [Oscillospiraceae bacterium]